MNCKLFSQALGAAPATLNQPMRDHMNECGQCAQLGAELRDFDQVLKSALHVDVPETLNANLLFEKLSEEAVSAEMGSTDKTVVEFKSKAKSSNAHVSDHQPDRSRRTAQFALAASLLLAVGVMFGAWVGRLAAPLPAGLVAHVQHEPALLGTTWTPVPAAELNKVLFSGGVSLNGDIGTVRHAGLCSFRGNKVAHVVVHTGKGPVTLMLLPDEHVKQATSFDEEGYKGLLVPIGQGSIAIIGDHADSLSEVQNRVSDKVAWTI